MVGRVLVVLALVSASGCGGQGGHARSGASPSSAVSGAGMSFDPPTRFDTHSAVTLPKESGGGRISLGRQVEGALPIALYKTAAYVASPDRLQVVNTLTGKVEAVNKPDHEPANTPGSGVFVGEDPTTPPTVVNVGGTALVLVPFVVKVPGQGTTPARRAVELVGVDAQSGRKAWSTMLELAPWANEESTTVTAAAVGTAGNTLVVRVFAISDGGSEATYAIDLQTRRIVWKQERFGAYAVTGTAVVGAATRDSVGTQVKVAAVSVTDGRSLWAAPKDSYELTITPAGPTLVVAKGRDYGSGAHFLQLLDAASGAVKDSGSVDYSAVDCQYDGISVTVCARSDGSFAAAFDARTAKWLWTLPDRRANRIAPRMTAAWHGAVYGTTPNGPVVLDARTGTDKDTSPGIAPYLVDGQVGIALDRTTADLRTYRAVR
jgi:hypothetical protein